MSNAKSNTKKQRTPRTSKGIHGAEKHPLTEVEKALLGKGLVRSTKHIPIKSDWRGASGFNDPWDPKQAVLNKVLYPHLFREDD